MKKANVVPQHPSSDFVKRHYKVVHELGQGTFGTVTLVQERASGEERVCKAVSTAGMPASTIELLKKEIQLLCALDHPNIVKLYEYAEDPKRNELVLVLEYLPGGDCLSLLRDARCQLAEPMVGRIVRQVLLSLGYCHAQGVVHRDIKPENIMLTEYGAWRAPDCKLIDFGLAARYDRPLKDFLGTASYVAPEALKRQADYTYTPKADIWALGVTVTELLSGVNPFGKPAENGGDLKPIFDRISAYGDFDDLEEMLGKSQVWQSRSSDAHSCVRWMLARDAAERPDAADALEHPWPERHRGPVAGITSEMLRGLAAFAEAPPLARYCLYIVAARLGVPDLESFGSAFLSLDVDGDGRITRDELLDGLGAAARRTWWGPDVDVDGLLEAADLENGGGLSFTEFVAACLSTRQSSLDELMISAFDALDDDRDGLVRVEAIRGVFRERPFPLLHRLPQDRPFDLEDWFGRFTGHLPPPGRSARTRAVRPLGFLDRLMDHFSCTPCRPADRGRYIIAPTERLVTGPSAPSAPVTCT